MTKPENGITKNGSTENVMPFWVAAIPFLILVSLLVANAWCFADATGGPNQIALLSSAAVAAILARLFGFSFQDAISGITAGIQAAIPALLILLVIGALSGTWMISGIVPAMIYYGLMILDPSYFLVATVVICAVVSLATGSSWSTIATVGIALLGIGNVLEVATAMTAGAIISGAYFGDKISPLSDTTNLAAAMAGADIFTHIRHMLWTTVPSISISLLLFAYLSQNVSDATLYVDQASSLSDALAGKFSITPWLFLVPLTVLVMVALKVNALASLVVGTGLGGVFAVLFQPDLLQEIAATQNGSLEPSYFVQLYQSLMTAMGEGFSLSSDNPEMNDLIGSSGMAGMLNTLWLIISAMCFGGVMEASGMLRALTRPIINAAKSDGGLIATTAATCGFFNLTASDQYLAIVVPGRMFRQAYHDRGLAPENLSRTLEDSATVTSVLVPWNTCGAMQAGVLGVAVLTFAPYCFFNLISPLMTIIFGYLGFSVTQKKYKIDPIEAV
ncbi:Na+/H+ antiporter NhaC [bacterium]|nr:Na+/H+ antiporter NhaC [bacterium]